MVPVEVWRQFGDRPKLRLEKADMIEVADNSVYTLLCRETRPNCAWKGAVRGDFNPRDLLILRLTEVRGLLERELREAMANGWDLKLAHETTAAGQRNSWSRSRSSGTGRRITT